MRLRIARIRVYSACRSPARSLPSITYFALASDVPVAAIRPDGVRNAIDSHCWSDGFDLILYNAKRME